ncbi:acyl-ACP--UDP-N-acetylglucosamine O-acyltransferase [Candidatus Margulisiibacteriota bacterium]
MKKENIDITSILKTLPHRYPFLLIDRVLEIEEGKRAVGLKNITFNEPYFQGHFPGLPVVPGVLMVEMMAQLGAIIALRRPEMAGKIVYFAGIDNVRFRKPVVPGDQLIIEAEASKMKGSIGKMKARAKVNNETVVEGEIMFSIGPPMQPGGVRIHNTATVHPSAELGKNVEIGPYTVIGPEVKIGENTSVGAHCTISKWVTIGKENVIHQNVTIGAPPQDYKYKGEKNEIVIGDKNIIREYVQIHLPSGEGTKTEIGNENFIMVHAHIPHNCKVGSQTVIGGYVGLGGYTQVGDQSIIGGLVGIHQFTRIGRLAMIGSSSKIAQDIPPFLLVDGNPATARGINFIGMQRRGVEEESIAEVKKAFKIFVSKTNVKHVVEDIRKKIKQTPEVEEFVDFLTAESKRGIIRKSGVAIAEKDIEEEIKTEMILPEIPELGI